MNDFKIDEELLEELFPDLEFDFTDEDGNKYHINNLKKRLEKKKENLNKWIENLKKS